MAVIKVRKVKATLSKAVRYVTNDAKTMERTLVTTSWNPAEKDPSRLASQMQRVVDSAVHAPRKGGLLAYHIIQSFSPSDPVDPETVHDLGIELMERIAPGRRWLVCTHTDREHIHNHILMVPVDPATGRHDRMPRDFIDRWRRASDELCRERGLSVLPDPAPVRTARPHGRSMAEIYASARGEGIKSAMRQAADLAAQKAGRFDAFRRELSAAGVDVSVRGAHLVYEDRATGLRVRDSRLGAAYMQDTVMARLGRQAVVQISFDESQIKESDAARAVVWVPGTRRRQTLPVPMRCVIRDGRTWRAFLPAGDPMTILARDGSYLRTLPDADALYEHFARPATPLTRMAGGEWKDAPAAGRTQAERDRWMRQARKLDALRDDVRALGKAMDATAGGRTLDDAVDALSADVARARAGLQAQLIARDEKARRGEEPDPADMDEISSRERDIDAMQQDLADLTKARRDLDRRARTRHDQQAHSKPRRGGKETRK